MMNNSVLLATALPSILTLLGVGVGLAITYGGYKIKMKNLSRSLLDFSKKVEYIEAELTKQSKDNLESKLALQRVADDRLRIKQVEDDFNEFSKQVLVTQTNIDNIQKVLTALQGDIKQILEHIIK